MNKFHQIKDFVAKEKPFFKKEGIKIDSEKKFIAFSKGKTVINLSLDSDGFLFEIDTIRVKQESAGQLRVSDEINELKNIISKIFEFPCCFYGVKSNWHTIPPEFENLFLQGIEEKDLTTCLVAVDWLNENNFTKESATLLLIIEKDLFPEKFNCWNCNRLHYRHTEENKRIFPELRTKFHCTRWGNHKKYYDFYSAIMDIQFINIT